MDRLEIGAHRESTGGGLTMNAAVAPPMLPPDMPATRHPRRMYAGFWRRFIALLVDGFLLSLLLGLGHLIIWWIHRSALGGTILDANGVTISHYDTLAALGRLVLDLGLPLLYFVFFESMAKAATPGKRLLGFQVRTTAGKKAGFIRILARNLLKGLSVACFMMGFLLAVVTPRRRALHDLMTGCVLLKIRRL